MARSGMTETICHDASRWSQIGLCAVAHAVCKWSDLPLSHVMAASLQPACKQTALHFAGTLMPHRRTTLKQATCWSPKLVVVVAVHVMYAGGRMCSCLWRTMTTN